ncbi:hypothetical protein JB92DRAFT_3106611 [Gautieria morchelliformis]|nr:hypothetical protein JB92DRAFT_3106611 [Gautieria morchelliformis]
MVEDISKAHAVPCGGADNDLDGCQRTFPRATTDLCRKCKKLSETTLLDIDRERVLAMKQCAQCGVFGTYITNPCGTCETKARKEDNLSNPEKDIAKERRLSLIQSRVGQDRQSIQGNMASTHASGPNTPQSELENIRTNTLKATWTVTYEVRLSTNPKAVSRELGSGSLTFNGDQTMPEVLESLVYQITPQWTKQLGHLYELHPDDCEIQFRDNKTLKKDTETLSIQKLYEFYSRGADRAFYLTNHRGTAKLPKGSYLCLEVFINVQKYLARTGEGGNEDFGLQVSMPQRGQKSGPGGARGGYKTRFVSAPATKRTRGSSIHRSDFIDHDLKAILPMKEGGAAHTIKFKKTTCSVDPASKWPNITEHEEILSGLLKDSPIILAAADQGRSKDVFKVHSGQQTYAAKTFRGSKDAIHEYPVYNELLFELACVQRLASFTEEFFEEVQG